MLRMITTFVFVIALLALPPASAVSNSARRVQTTFNLLVLSSQPTTSPNATFSASPQPLVVPASCPNKITFSKIQTYRRIDQEFPNTARDGILWQDVLIDDQPCQSSAFVTTTTYFIPVPSSSPQTAPDVAEPFFLHGFDNSPLRCPTFRAKYAFRHFYTDDLPRFRTRLLADGLLPQSLAQISSRRGDIFAFFIPAISLSGDVFSRPVCVLSAPLPSITPTPVPSPSPEAVCFSARMPVALASGVSVPMSELRIGHKLPDNHGSIVSFSHADPLISTTLLAIRVLLPHNSTVDLEISHGHFVVTDDDVPIPARMIRPGHIVQARGGLAIVTAVRSVRAKGLFAPITISGRIFVNDVLCSCYTDLFLEHEAHALLTPVRAAAAILKWDWLRLIDSLRSLLY